RSWAARWRSTCASSTRTPPRPSGRAHTPVGRSRRSIPAMASPGAAEVDVVVIGAGSAGAALALALRQRRRSVAVVERAPSQTRRVGEPLAANACLPLRELGVWEAFVAEGHRPAYARRAIWGSAEPRERSSVFDRFGHAHHLDRAAFDRWLREHA